MLASKKLEDKTEYKRNTALAKKEVRRRHTASWDKSVTNLEHEPYRTQPKVHKILKQIRKDININGYKGNREALMKMYFLNTIKKYGTQQTYMNQN